MNRFYSKNINLQKEDRKRRVYLHYMYKTRNVFNYITGMSTFGFLSLIMHYTKCFFQRVEGNFQKHNMRIYQKEYYSLRFEQLINKHNRCKSNTSFMSKDLFK